MITNIEVNKIDLPFLEQVKKAHSALKSSTDEVKEIHIHVDSAKGDIEVALDIAQILHSDASVIPVTSASGNLDSAATVIVAAGIEGRRSSDPKSAFTLNDGEGYGKDSKPEDLEGSDYAVYDAMASLTGRKNIILKKIIEGGEFSVKVAKNCKIIDKINGFENAFKPKKRATRIGKKKSAVSVKSADSAAEVENVANETESTEEKTNVKKRNTTEDKTSSEGVQRGRIK